MKGGNGMFQVNQNDLEYLFESVSQTVTINDTERKAIITNPSLSEYEERHIHTLDSIQMGDTVTLDNEKYLVITESINKRNAKYKALMRHCNNTIEIPVFTEVIIGVDDFGRPVTKKVYGEPILVPSIVDNKFFSVDNSSPIRVPNNQIIVTVQDNQVHKSKFKVNDTFECVEGNYKVLNRDFTKKGLIIITAEWITA